MTYSLTSESVEWSESERACQNQNQSFARIHSKDQLKEATEPIDLSQNAWIGMKKVAKFGICPGITNATSIMSSLQWTFGEPSVTKLPMKSLKIQRCGADCFVIQDGKIRDFDCASTEAILCEGELQVFTEFVARCVHRVHFCSFKIQSIFIF